MALSTFKQLRTIPVDTAFEPDMVRMTQSPYVVSAAAGASNPVLTAADVTDSPLTETDFVADPAIYVDAGGTWHMLMEGSDGGTIISFIGHATSTDGLSWTYDQVAINDHTQEAFPYIFETTAGDVYVANQGDGTDNDTAGVVLNKKGTDWASWTEVNANLFGLTTSHGDAPIWRDPTTGTYYAFVTDYDNTQCRLFYNTGDIEVTADWTEHSASPIASGGVYQANAVFRWDYGDGFAFLRNNDTAVDGYRIDDLTTSTYSESVVQTDVVAPTGTGWRESQMHSYDGWYNGNGNGELIVAVDGKDSAGEWTIGIYKA